MRLRRGETWARVSQSAAYVGVKIQRRQIADDEALAGKAFKRLFRTMGERGAIQMAQRACREIGAHYRSDDKAAERVKADLRLMGEEPLWRAAKIKSGRPPNRRK